MMTIHPVKSSTIFRVGYDQLTVVMRLYFWNGEEKRQLTAVWEYEDTSIPKAMGLVDAESPGKFWNGYLRVLVAPRGRMLKGLELARAVSELDPPDRDSIDITLLKGGPFDV